MSSKLRDKLNIKSLVLVLVVLLIALLLFLYINKVSSAESLSIQSSNLVVEFSGKYYMGDGLGMNCNFEIDADSNFHISWSTDTGHKVTYKGSVSFEDGQFVLTPTDKVETPAPCFHRTFTPVNWGKRKYLLPNDDDDVSKYIASTFCKSVKDGDEPRDKLHGFSYLRTTDITIKVTGFPTRQDGRLQCSIFAHVQ